LRIIGLAGHLIASLSWAERPERKGDIAWLAKRVGKLPPGLRLALGRLASLASREYECHKDAVQYVVAQLFPLADSFKPEVGQVVEKEVVDALIRGRETIFSASE
jgi:hypothetical protein